MSPKIIITESPDDIDWVLTNTNYQLEVSLHMNPDKLDEDTHLTFYVGLKIILLASKVII